MKWQGRRESDQVEDRRGMSGRQVAFGGGGLTLLGAGRGAARAGVSGLRRHRGSRRGPGAGARARARRAFHAPAGNASAEVAA